MAEISPFVDSTSPQYSRQFDIETIGGDQKKRLAEMLRGQMFNQPQGQMVSGWYVKPSWAQQMVPALGGVLGTYLGKEADREQAQKTSEALKRFGGVEEKSVGTDGVEQTKTRPLTQDEQDMALMNLASVNPQIAGVYGGLLSARATRAQKLEDALILQRQRAEDQQNLARLHGAIAAGNRQGNGSGGDQWKYDAGSDTWVMPPNAQFPMGRVTPNVGKVGALQNIGHTIEGFKGAYTPEGSPVVDAKGKPVNPGLLNTATQGGWMGISGLVGRATNSQEARAFDNKVEQLSNDLRRVFRIPGEGTLSDKDAAAIGIQLPKLGNSRELNEQILNDIQVRASNQVMPGGVNPLQMNPTAGKNGFGAPPAGAVREKK